MTAPALAAPAAPPERRPITPLVAEVAAVADQHARSADRQARFPVEALTAMRGNGLLGLNTPVEHGGLGGSLRDVVDAGVALGRADLSVALIFVMHCQQVAAIDGFASGTLRRDLLARVASGRLYIGSVTTEVGTGGHLLSSGSRLQRQRASLVIDRFAPVVTGGMHADGFLITMQSPDARGPHEVSLVYAHRSQLRIHQAGGWDALGMRASESVPLQLSGAVPAGQVVGPPGGFRDIAVQTFAPMAHIGWSAAWLGAAAGALSRTLAALRHPGTGANSKLDSEILLRRLSTARMRLETVNGLLRHTVRIVEDEPDRSIPRVQLLLNSLKITASEQCHACAEDLVEAVGMRHGYLAGSPTRLEQVVRDLRSATLNYSNDRLHLTSGKMCFLDPQVRLG
jgi:acyl-CoA dehydrogenase